MADAQDPREPPPRLLPSPTKQFAKDFEAMRRRGRDPGRLRAVIETLCSRGAMDLRHRDHALKGEWRRFRECHIEFDWLLIYRVDGEKLFLERTGTHPDLFG